MLYPAVADRLLGLCIPRFPLLLLEGRRIELCSHLRVSDLLFGTFAVTVFCQGGVETAQSTNSGQHAVKTGGGIGPKPSCQAATGVLRSFFF